VMLSCRSSPRRFASPVGLQGWKVICVVALPLIIGVRQSMAQSQPVTIPTVVAQAMAFEPAFLGRPQYFDGRTPTDWPAALVPPAAKVVGGGIVGDSAMYRMRVAVFEFSAKANPRAVLEDMVVRAGYAHPTFEPPHSQTGGFSNTPAPTPQSINYCKGSTLAAFGPMDSVRTPTVFAVMLLDGEAGRQSCSPQRNESSTTHRFPAPVPQLFPPPGAMSAGGGGSSWSGSDGEMRSMLRTTMPTDSLLAHYSKQLVAGGWKTEGRPANADGVGAQRFSFSEGQDAWKGVLIVLALGERREILLQVSKKE
jgi:hypothetical protein